MSIRQQRSELRYVKRTNLEQESKIVGNWYRDLIRSYGVDISYRKLDTACFEDYTSTVDNNTLLQRAYGYEVSPQYFCSADMVAYLEVDQDIFQLQKYGMNPNTDVNFYFDATDFACDLAERCGQYEETKISADFTRDVTGLSSAVLSIEYVAVDGTLSGMISVMVNDLSTISSDELPCKSCTNTPYLRKFPANSYLAKSLKHEVTHEDIHLPSLATLSYYISVEIWPDPNWNDVNKQILHGTIDGSILTYSLNKVGKYLDKIHPEVGDIITLDFPDAVNPDMYEITDCFDKSLQQDGISPLLHNYIWKCKARRYINNEDVIEETEADQRQQEKKDFETVVDEEVTEKIAGYEDNEDRAYGGYEQLSADFDNMIPRPDLDQKYEEFSADQMLLMHEFSCGSQLVTDGYEVYFVSKPKDGSEPDAYQLTLGDVVPPEATRKFESGLRFLKASKNMLVFTNVEGQTYKLAENVDATKGQLEICLNSLFDKTLDTKQNINLPNCSFYKFKESKTFLWATRMHLYCRLESDKSLFRLV